MSPAATAFSISVFTVGTYVLTSPGQVTSNAPSCTDVKAGASTSWLTMPGASACATNTGWAVQRVAMAAGVVTLAWRTLTVATLAGLKPGNAVSRVPRLGSMKSGGASSVPAARGAPGLARNAAWTGQNAVISAGVDALLMSVFSVGTCTGPRAGKALRRVLRSVCVNAGGATTSRTMPGPAALARNAAWALQNAITSVRGAVLARSSFTPGTWASARPTKPVSSWPRCGSVNAGPRNWLAMPRAWALFMNTAWAGQNVVMAAAVAPFPLKTLRTPACTKVRAGNAVSRVLNSSSVKPGADATSTLRIVGAPPCATKAVWVVQKAATGTGRAFTWTSSTFTLGTWAVARRRKPVTRLLRSSRLNPGERRLVTTCAAPARATKAAWVLQNAAMTGIAFFAPISTLTTATLPSARPGKACSRSPRSPRPKPRCARSWPAIWWPW